MRSIPRSGEFVAEPILSIKDLTVEFDTEDGIVNAVTDVSYDVCPAKSSASSASRGRGRASR